MPPRPRAPGKAARHPPAAAPVPALATQADSGFMEAQEEALKRDHSQLIAGGSGYSQSALSSSARLAWLYVSLMGLSFACLSLALCWLVPVDEAVWDTFIQQVDERVFQWQLAGFGGVLLLNLINLLFCANPVQYNCNLLLGLIHGVAFATDCMIAFRATPVVVSASGHMFLPLRSIQWLHTTPTMIQLMSMMGGLTGRQVAAAIAADAVMVLTGLAASWTTGLMQLFNLTISTLAFFMVMHAVVLMFRSAMAESVADPAGRVLLGRMLLLTLGVWSLFPVVWLLAYGGLVSVCLEQVLWGVSDYSAKVVFSSHLWQKNLATVQQRREAAQELMGALDRGLLMERLRALLAAKERLVYALSHELTMPINGMLALVQELLYNKTQSSASRTKMLLMIRSSATCLLNTINTTLHGNSSGGANGAGPQRRQHKVPLWRVTELVLRLTRPLLKENVRLVNCISRDMPSVKGDKIRIMQVLMNLVCSCLKFTHTGVITISASTTHSDAQVVVADSGQGIPAAQLAHALDPFDQADGAGSESAAMWDVCRSGLGLYLVRQALTAMGSSLEAVSEVGKGSTFTFELPLADDECDSESDIDSFSEAPSLRASLELADLDGPQWRTQGTPGKQQQQQQQQQQGQGAQSDNSQQSSGSKRQSLDMMLHTPSAGAAAAAARLRGTVAAAGSNSTGGSSTPALGSTTGSMSSAEAAAAEAAQQQQQQQQYRGSSSLDIGTTHGLPPAAAAAAAAAGIGSSPGGSGSWCGSPWPLKPTHRSIDGVIQVLSVDDDPVNQLVASTALRSHKWEVVKSMSGAEALEYLDRGCSVLPDLVLLDVMMPAMTGYEVAARIRQHYPSSLLPIIMVSAKTEEDDIVQGLRCGADDYVTKPFKRSELAARIRAHIRARDAFQEQQAAEQQWLLQHNLLPLTVQRKLRAGETVIAESHPAATVLWAEVLGGIQQPQQQQLEVLHSLPDSPAAAAAAGGGAGAGGLTTGRRSVGLTPAEAVVRLNSLYTTWEELCAEQDVLGVDFSGSTFVAVSGHDDNPAHLRLILAAAERMLSVVGGMTHPDGSPLAVRIGIHTGPLTTGLVGSKAVKLVLMGDTVEVARQLAASGAATGCHISADVYSHLSAADSALKATAMPWTLQQLPGSSSPQHTYLLPHAEAAAAAGWTSQQQQQQMLAGSGQAAAAAAGGAPREIGVGRMDRFLGRAVAAAAAAADREEQQQQQQQIAGSGGSGGSSAAAAAAAQGVSLLQPSSHGSSSSSLHRQASGTSAAASADLGKLASTAAAAAAGGAGSSSGSGRLPTVVTAALPAPAPGGSVGFGVHQQRSSSSRDNNNNNSSSRENSAVRPLPVAGLSLAAADAQAPAAAAAAVVVEQGCGQEEEADDEAWLLSNDHHHHHHPHQQQQQRSRRSSATASAQLTPHSSVVAAMAAAAAASFTAPPAHHPQQQQHPHHHQLLLQRQQSADIQQLQAASAQLLQQLGSERQQLQQQLLQATQQASSAAGELSVLRQQLSDAQAAASSQGLMIEALRQQLGQALMRAHLADCWRSLATLKFQITSIAGQEATAVATATAPAAPRQAAPAAGLPVPMLAAGAPGSAAGGSSASTSNGPLLPVGGLPPALAVGESGSSGPLPALVASGSARPEHGGPGAAPSLQQLLHAQSSQLAALQQQQQLLLVASLQQQLASEPGSARAGGTLGTRSQHDPASAAAAVSVAALAAGAAGNASSA